MLMSTREEAACSLLAPIIPRSYFKHALPFSVYLRQCPVTVTAFMLTVFLAEVQQTC
jgi:hypothetical protein